MNDTRIEQLERERDEYKRIAKYIEDCHMKAEAKLATAQGEACRHGWRGAAPKDGQHIKTPCPECGCESLFIGEGGHLTCARVGSAHGEYNGCPNPDVEDVVKKLKAALAEARWKFEHTPHGKKRNDVCVWVQDSDGPWNTSCGKTWEFTDGGPEENDAYFCHHCGGALLPEPYIDDAIDDAAIDAAKGNP